MKFRTSPVTAVIALRPGAEATEEALRDTASEHIARYKLPRAIVFVDHIVRAPSGKADYRWAKQTAEDKIGDGV